MRERIGKIKHYCMPKDNRHEKPGKVLMVKIDNATIFHKFYLWMSKLRICYFIRTGSSVDGGQSLIRKIIKINDLLMKELQKKVPLQKMISQIYYPRWLTPEVYYACLLKESIRAVS